MAGNLTAMIASIFSGSAVTADPYYEYTTLLLPGSGTNGAQNNTFLDGSTNNFTITRNGNTTQGTFSPFSQTGWGNYFDGTGDMLATPSITIGASAFCFECWLYPTVTQGNTTGIFVGNTTNSLQISYFGTVGLGIAQKGVAWQVNNSDSVIPIVNQWNHVAFVRSGTGANQTSVYLNGTRIANGTVSYSYAASTYEISTTQAGGTVFQGYISNARLTVGSSPYDATSSTLIVPTAPLTAITNTQLLTCQSNRFRDASTNNFTITVNGDTRVVAFSPFNPTASWSAATYGGSGYFDGSGDSLTCSSILPATSDFTLSFWVYPTSLAGYVVGGAIRQADSGNIFQFFLGYTDGRPSIQIGGVYNDFTAGTIKANQWHYIQLVKASSAYTLYVNGTALSVTASNGNIGTTSIASGTFYVQYNTGCYFSDVRVVASALSNTVPTAPLTAITNTSLLLNFTNAGVYDATSKNDLETVGNAQISNTTAKWGSTSIKFDGTGDYLQAPDSELIEFGSGDFTIETWVRFAALPSSGAYYTLVSKWDNSTQKSYLWYVYNASGTYQLYFTYTTNGSTNINPVATITPSINTWYHYAVSRSGANLRMFIDGTQVGSTYNIATDTIFGGTYPLQVGASTGANTLNGYMQDVRVTKGYARYTANFTAPTAAFPTL
jgi:hypothetical protein